MVIVFDTRSAHSRTLIAPACHREVAPPIVVDIEIGLGHIKNYVIVSGITDEYGGNDLSLFLHMQQPPRRGWNPAQMDLLACERVPTAVRAMIHPASFQPRKNIVGWVRDSGRKHLMWHMQQPPKRSGTQ